MEKFGRISFLVLLLAGGQTFYGRERTLGEEEPFRHVRLAELRKTDVLMVRERRKTEGEQRVLVEKTEKQVPVDFIFVKGGTFQMDSQGELGGEDSGYSVGLGDFAISKFEITFEEYDAYCASTGVAKPSDSNWGRDDRPVINVSWFDAVRYCNWRSEQEGLTPAYTIKRNVVKWDKNAGGYRLPTEAEWEYAARGGQESLDYKYAGSDALSEVAWYYGNSGRITHPVGVKRPNELAIHDMSGNVWEWCWDWYDEYPYGDTHHTNPAGPAKGKFKVLRGGDWGNGSDHGRVTKRHSNYPDYSNSHYGFRIVLSVE